MKKLLILFLFLASPIYANNICFDPYVKVYKMIRVHDLDSLTTRTFNRLREKINNASSDREKLNLIDQQYELIQSEYEMQLERAKNLININNLTKEEASKTYTKIYESIISTYRYEINFMVNESKNLLAKVGINTKVKYNIYSENVKVKYLEFDPEGSFGKGAERISRYKKKMNTNAVTFAFMKNIESSSAGFSIAQIRRIDLGLMGIRNLVLDDLLTMVAKHEFKHGGFAKARVLGIDSIYHPDYMSLNGAPLTIGGGSGYSQYMSAEELYNFVNNPLWASSRIKNIQNFEMQDIIGDINRIRYYLKLTKGIAEQTQELTSDFIKLLEDSAFDPNKVSLLFLNDQRKAVESVEEVFSLGVVDVEKGRVLNFYLPPSLKREIEEIFVAKSQTFEKYGAEYSELIKADKKDEAMELFARAEEEEKAEALVQYQAIFAHIIKNQKTLNLVAEKINPVNDKALEATEEFSNMIGQIPADLDLQNSPEIVDSFKAIAQMYRNLGSLVRENYKGFIAK